MRQIFLGRAGAVFLSPLPSYIFPHPTPILNTMFKNATNRHLFIQSAFRDAVTLLKHNTL